ncbi:hypothetical protein P167DRAFT_539391 [Morchella conica CCBAS932]|uniref:Extracellular membrane protein CFEM domain-containing protein n=1 Tax=Morchella conica CCBAS932 TaxID=1392247 RepID=A0A3N4KJ20_9PEZI|nr:hypothetical protein P167DRAFT_539391 [Morchella conica CCBAS932]
MVVLNFGGWIRRSLLLIFVFLQVARASTLITLAKATCLQRCFISTCPDLEADCVCKSLLDAKTTLCTNDSCGEEISYLSLAQECKRYLPTSSLTTTSTATPTISSIVAPTTTAPYPTELERLPTSTSVSLTTDASAPQTSSESQADTQSTRGPSLKQRALTAVFVLAPVSIVLMLVAIFVVIRRRKQARRSISSFAGVKGWNRSSMALAEPAPVRDVEQQFPPRVADQVRGGFSLFPKPPTFPAQVRRSSAALTTMEPKKVLPEVPPMSQHRPITRISEVSETASPTRDIGTFQTMDSELQRAFLEVRQGFRPNSTRSSAGTSMDWSMMIDISQSSNTGSRRDSELSSKAGSKTDTRFSWQ